jgi:hypothetical protein
MSATALAVSWGPVVAVSTSAHGFALPESTVVTGTQKVHVFYTEFGTKYQAWYRQSADGGATWASPVLISHSSAYGAEASAINRNGTTLDVVWWEWNSTNQTRVWYRNSVNAGTSWSTPIALSAIGDVGKSDVARDGSRVTVTWTDGATGKVYVRISTNGGGSFATKVSLGTTSNQPFLPDASSYEAYVSDGDSAGTISVVWDSSSTTIKMRRSTDGGANWSTAVTLDTNSYGAWVTLTTAASKIIIGYKFKTTNGSRATQRHSSDEGLHWTAAGYVGRLPSAVPMYAYGGGVLRATYNGCPVSDCSTGEATYYRTSTDFGTTWSTESKVSRSTDTPNAYAVGIGVIANGQSVVIYRRTDFSTFDYLYARKSS